MHMEFLETVKDAASGAAETVYDYFEGDMVTTRRKVMTVCAMFAFAGIVLGFLISPIKKGFYFNISNNGNGLPPEEEKKESCKCQKSGKRQHKK